MNSMTRGARYGPITDAERDAVARRHFANCTPSKIRAIARVRLLDVLILGRLALEEKRLCE